MKLLPALAVAIVRRTRRLVRRFSVPFKIAGVVLLLCFFEALLHTHRHSIPRPPQDLDGPFATQCQDPRIAAASQPRENAAFVMLARNSEINEARQTIQNIEAQFNQWFNYPVVFLNNEPWDPDFIRELNASVSGKAIFETIPEESWSYPPWMHPESARQSMAQQAKLGVWNGGKESYHHMCRFYSGTFYTLPALAPFKWYWRLEPGVHFTCAITYDPFAAMARHNKTYGFTIALWEEPNTCPSLFRTVDDFRRKHHLPKTPTWNAMLDTATAGTSPWYLQPFPVRKLLGLLGRPHHARSGERWNLCHYWSNFEMADLDFFRSDAYQRLFDHLDRQGGFYHERWGDAPVHSLAVHLLLPPGKLHHFSDFGYHHEPFFQCPGNAPGGQLPGNEALAGNHENENEGTESEGAIGCRCRCVDQRRRNNRGICLDRMQRPAASHRTGWWDRWRGKYPYTINIPG
ncbi:glycolipid 2-alpha-mannosyltransferase 1 [Chaetomidium leptoderma]|uniref:Glycolipid 2-alpha-mannosyltransferase 1 n=1 Tax=Chaetomidium leptoderma TaxID=669021 RepID=A0AAN6VBQ8_9PEZI|nr:glycolipid 2-alpha-mannosyltransferase 1 [Chaetomidium leptoderma]